MANELSDHLQQYIHAN